MSTGPKLFEPMQQAEIKWQDAHPCSLLYDDGYFSQAGAVAESNYVYIQGNQLIERFSMLASSHPLTFMIGELGFGSGLNFLVTWSLWRKHAPIQAQLYYFSSEKHPLSLAQLQEMLVLCPEFADLALHLEAVYPLGIAGFHKLSFDQDRVHLFLLFGDSKQVYQELWLNAAANSGSDQSLTQDAVLYQDLKIDAWYLDGFAPAKNPAQWSHELLKVIKSLSKKGTTLSSFSAAGKVKRSLMALGFEIRMKQGFGRKREMITGFLPFDNGSVQTTENKERNRWQKKEAFVLGAGLAGLTVAHALAKRGFRVTVLEKASKLASGASGNRHALLYPQFSAFSSPLSRWQLAAFLFAKRFYKSLDLDGNIAKLSGLIHLVRTEKQAAQAQYLNAFFSSYPELGKFLDREEASKFAGIPLSSNGFFLADSGWINSVLLCEHLSKAPGIELHLGESVEALQFADGFWTYKGLNKPILVLASGYEANQFSETRELWLRAVRGQITEMGSTPASQMLSLPICGQAHVLPAINEMHSIGSTYVLDSKVCVPSLTEDLDNRARVNLLSSEEGIWSTKIQGHWAGIRGASLDYLPLLGQVPRWGQFKENSYHLGLYIAAGFGSRGLCSIPLAAEILAAMIHQEPAPVPSAMMRSICPSRFIKRQSKKN